MPYYYTPNIGGYNPYMQQQIQPQIQPTQAQVTQPVPQIQTAQQTTNGLNWVSGEVGAKSFLVAPNNTVMLMDSESDRFYIKSADASGMPLPLRTFTYKEIGTNSTRTDSLKDSEKYVTKTEFMDLVSKYNALIEKLNGGAEDAESVIQPVQQKKSTEYDFRDK